MKNIHPWPLHYQLFNSIWISRLACYTTNEKNKNIKVALHILDIWILQAYQDYKVLICFPKFHLSICCLTLLGIIPTHRKAEEILIKSWCNIVIPCNESVLYQYRENIELKWVFPLHLSLSPSFFSIELILKVPQIRNSSLELFTSILTD